ncbi:MAG TPA: hypothetical protein VK879_03765, partial [Candidatus Sulfomarinibacteraceae bacterium]|nr:hypothetical protein [Candidatus Sulfomarinibacteraceae bacterium]
MSDAPTTQYSIRDVLANRPLMVAIGAILIGLCLLTVFAILLLRGQGILGNGGEPTPFPAADVATENDVIVGGLSGSTPVSLTLNMPTSLQVGTQTFGVRPEPVDEDGIWAPELTEGRTALWVYGSLINYVIGLPSNNDNRSLLESMGPGDELLLTMRDGTVHRFAVTNREYVSTDRRDVFEQSTPGLTLILVRASGDERLVVQADYVVDTTSAGSVDDDSAGAGNAVELGETAQLGNLRLTVTDASALYDRAEAPPGFIFYLVNFQIQNAGTQPVDLGELRFVLNDDLGNQYAMNQQAAQIGAAEAGGNQPPSGVLASEEMRNATAGYQIPAGLSSPRLTWIVRRAGGTGQIQVSIPFAETSAAAAQQATVNLQGAEVSADGTGLVLTGQITNNGSQPLIVSESNVTLMSNGTVHLMLSTNPAFPWTVPPGQSVPFSLSFKRPSGA